MLEKLIQDGEQLESQVQTEPDYGGLKKKLSGIQFEQWAAACVFYLEEARPKSSQTEKVIALNKNLNNDSYEKYQIILGIMKALKEVEDVNAASARAIWGLNKG